MPGDDPRTILGAFGGERKRYLYLMGGGGKTALMFALAHALRAAGRTVITTTSTRILAPGPAETGAVLLGSDAPSLITRLAQELPAHGHVTVAAARLADEGKLRGLGLEQLDALVDARVADHVLVEGDGAAGRSLKAHREGEPVLSPRAETVIVVIGLDCLGAPMDDEHVHRAASFRERLGLPPGSVVTAEDVAGICFHPEGYLARVPQRAEVVVFLNKAVTPEAASAARQLADMLRTRDRTRRIGAIVVGDVRAGEYRV
jgi:probable selenium-dependent hydroxylase accessory protein YqeC